MEISVKELSRFITKIDNDINVCDTSFLISYNSHPIGEEAKCLTKMANSLEAGIAIVVKIPEAISLKCINICLCRDDIQEDAWSIRVHLLTPKLNLA